jgi:hypothetical protein
MAGEQTTEVVFIDFQTNLSELESATDILEKTGQIDKKTADAFKKTNAEIDKRKKVVNDAAKATQAATQKQMISIEELNAYMEKFFSDFVSGMQEGVIDALKEAGFEFDEFGNIINKNKDKVNKDVGSMKKELSDINKELAAMKLRGEENTQQFLELAQRGGQLKDAIGDAAREVNRFASDTRNIDGLIDLTNGLAGSFAVAQGAAALFGSEGEALQETLVKVNSALAILQGLQSATNLLQKDSAAITTLNTIAQRGYTFAVGESIGALKAFRVALALTGIGALILGLTALVMWLNRANEEIEANTKALRLLNAELDRDIENLDRYTSEIQQASAVRIAALEAQGAANKKIRDEQREATAEELRGVFELQQAYRDRANAAEETLRQIALGNRKFTEEEVEEAERTVQTFAELTERRKQLATDLRVQAIQDERETQREQLQAIVDGLEAQLAATRQNSAKELEVNKQLARARANVELNEAGQNAAKRKLIEANLRKELRELDAEYARVRQQDRISQLEAELTKEQSEREKITSRTSQREIDLQANIIKEQARLELMQTGLTEGQKTAIVQKSLSDRLKLQREFTKQSAQESLEDFISRNNRELEQLNISNEERLRLTEENIIVQSQLEINAAEGLSDKIKEIEAKRDADLRAARLASIQQRVQYEEELQTAQTGVLRRAQERILNSERATLRQRITAINQLAALDIEAINRRQDALEEAHNKGLISEKEYILEYEKLKDEELRVTEETERAKTEVRRKAAIEQANIAIQITSQVLEIFQLESQQRLEAQQNELNYQRQQIADLRETGAITEKEATARQKKIDAEEKRLRRQQAEREKQFAIFKAVLAIPQAYLTGLTQGGPILGAIYAGLAAAQAIVIASRQIPKFGRGKHNEYEGPAEIGETGPELWQTDMGMYYVPKKTIVWVGKKDQVFNPTETKKMLERPAMNIENSYQNVNNTGSVFNIDYDKMGESIAKRMPQTGFNFDKDGFTMWALGQNSLNKYLDKRRSYGV